MRRNLYDFRHLFVLDMANNHQGSINHGLRIIREAARVANANKIRAGLKFQFRQLDTFIHPSHRDNSTNKHVPRFLSTRLSAEDYAVMAEEVRRHGMVTIATPFDEQSVDLLVDLGIDVAKIASCSASDWPLIEKIADCGKPVICSTGGLTLEEIDNLVSFFEHRRVHFALMHCVSVYPTPDEHMQLNQIELLRNRYRNTPIGFSTHENPDDLSPVQIAVAKGAVVFERHVGVETDEIKLNAYSSTPEQLDRWFKAFQKARLLCGVDAKREPAIQEEVAALSSLKRGIFACDVIPAGSTIAVANVYFAFPYQEGQISSGQWREGMVATAEIRPDHPLTHEAVKVPEEREKQVIYQSIHAVKAMLNEACISLASGFSVEFSHHHGLSHFHEVGAIIIDVINRTYCKKLVVQLPGQCHPSHYHKRKEETFQVLWGTLDIIVDGRRRTLQPGDTALVQQGVWHEFWTETGVIFEEISTTHYNDDSFYEDKEINRKARSERKTVVNHWGRYQI